MVIIYKILVGTSFSKSNEVGSSTFSTLAFCICFVATNLKFSLPSFCVLIHYLNKSFFHDITKLDDITTTLAMCIHAFIMSVRHNATALIFSYERPHNAYANIIKLAKCIYVVT